MGPFQRVAEPAWERVDATVRACAELERYVEAKGSVLAHQVAWTLLQKVFALTIDYDMRLCPAGALEGSRRRLTEALRSVAEKVCGPLDNEAMQQLALPGPLGGCGLRLATEDSANAAFWPGRRTASMCWQWRPA